jgi:hypothetical protein
VGKTNVGKNCRKKIIATWYLHRWNAKKREKTRDGKKSCS